MREVAPMKSLILALTFLLSGSIAVAKERNWQDAIVVAITSGTSGAMAVPVGNMVVAAPMSEQIFWIKSGNITYGLRRVYIGHPPNLTVHGHTQIAFDGRNVHILDEDGKDRRFVIVQKVADKS
jgi:hypothetical protein